MAPQGKSPGAPPSRVPEANGHRRIKWAVLGFLVFQNSGASLLMRYSRSQAGGEMWNSQTGVILQEVVKALACIAFSVWEGSLRRTFADPLECAKTAVPAALYLAQNNLQYISVTYLDASAYAVLYQLKIITTALMSVALLKKHLSMTQWLSLVILTVGVSIVVLSQMSAERGADGARRNLVWGTAAVLLACCSSGLAGVYFEKLLKGSTVSLWTRNLQLALYSIAIGVSALYGGDPAFSFRRDFFRGYSISTWCSILNNALGGLLIAVVIKYADNIMKNFAASLSIILTAVASALIFGSVINALFCVGTMLVLYAVMLYGTANALAPLRSLRPSWSPWSRRPRSPP